MANPIDRFAAFLSPSWALRRAQSRRALSYYEAARTSRTRKSRREPGSADTAVSRAGTAIREQARHLEQNHDLARGVLSVLVANTVGPNGITVEPQPRTKSGEIHDELAKQIGELLRDWAKRPEVTWRHDWPSAQRILARTWFRDGEGFSQLLAGNIPTLDHGTRVPFSLELIEPDHVPLDYSEGSRIVQGIERNTWGRAVAFWVHKNHPGDIYQGLRVYRSDLKRVPADRMLHVAMVDRIRQTRGMSVFASVLQRFDDLKDYEESERIAAKVAASMAAMIIKGSPEEYQPETDEEGNPIRRSMQFTPGMIFDDLAPGERVETIDTNRPNPNLPHHRDGQLRAAAAGTNVSFSSLSKNYNGTYSAQRQELVESYGAYGILSSEFTAQFVRPVMERCIETAVLAGKLRIPADVDPATITDALYIGPQMPWIDPLKEAAAWSKLEENTYASGPEIIRRRGQNPADVLEQERRWKRLRNNMPESNGSE